MRKVASVGSLGWLRVLQGRYAAAEPLATWALTVREKMQGPEHLDVAFELNTLATACWYQARYAEAEPLYRRALALREKALGPKHPGVADVLNNLANLYRSEGKLTQAEPLYRRALAIEEHDAPSSDHPKPWRTCSYNLAHGRFRRAGSVRRGRGALQAGHGDQGEDDRGRQP